MTGVSFLSVTESLHQIIWAAVAIFAAVYLQKWWKTKTRRKELRAKILAFQTGETGRRRQLFRELKANNDGDAIILTLPFEQLRAKLAAGDLSAVDVLHAYQTAALRSTEKTNSVTEFIVNAEEKARQLDSQKKRLPLHGIPFSVKECFLIPGTEASEGHSQFLGQYRNEGTAPIVKFLEDLGAIPFVKTNLPQAMMSFDSRNCIHGMTKNPYNLTRSPGGSTSGEGALVGAKASILGVGSDAGGSLRIPAVWCGCWTMKPTSCRMLAGKSFPSQFYFPRSIVRDFCANGFITQDCDTLVTLHRLLYSTSTFDKFLFNSMAPIPFREDLFQPNDNRPLTIGFCYTDEVVETVPAMKRAVKLAKEALERRGHRLVEWKAPMMREAFLLYMRTMTIDGTVEIIQQIEDDVEVCFQNRTTMLAQKVPFWLKSAVAMSARRFVGDLPAELLKSTKCGKHPHDVNVEFVQLRHYRRNFAKAFEDASLDALLWPGFACPAVPLNLPRDILPAVSYTALFNWLDWPAGVCPITTVTADDEVAMANYPAKRDIFHQAVKKGMLSNTQGLPVAVQIAAPQFREEIVLRLMSEISKEITAPQCQITRHGEQ